MVLSGLRRGRFSDPARAIPIVIPIQRVPSTRANRNPRNNGRGRAVHNEPRSYRDALVLSRERGFANQQVDQRREHRVAVAAGHQVEMQRQGDFVGGGMPSQAPPVGHGQALQQQVAPQLQVDAAATGQLAPNQPHVAFVSREAPGQAPPVGHGQALQQQVAPQQQANAAATGQLAPHQPHAAFVGREAPGQAPPRGHGQAPQHLVPASLPSSFVGAALPAQTSSISMAIGDVARSTLPVNGPALFSSASVATTSPASVASLQSEPSHPDLAAVVAAAGAQHHVAPAGSGVFDLPYREPMAQRQSIAAATAVWAAQQQQFAISALAADDQQAALPGRGPASQHPAAATIAESSASSIFGNAARYALSGSKAAEHDAPAVAGGTRAQQHFAPASSVFSTHRAAAPLSTMSSLQPAPTPLDFAAAAATAGAQYPPSAPWTVPAAGAVSPTDFSPAALLARANIARAQQDAVAVFAASMQEYASSLAQPPLTALDIYQQLHSGGNFIQQPPPGPLAPPALDSAVQYGATQNFGTNGMVAAAVKDPSTMFAAPPQHPSTHPPFQVNRTTQLSAAQLEGEWTWRPSGFQNTFERGTSRGPRGGRDRNIHGNRNGQRSWTHRNSSTRGRNSGNSNSVPSTPYPYPVPAPYSAYGSQLGMPLSPPWNYPSVPSYLGGHHVCNGSICNGTHRN